VLPCPLARRSVASMSQTTEATTHAPAPAHLASGGGSTAHSSGSSTAHSSPAGGLDGGAARASAGPGCAKREPGGPPARSGGADVRARQHMMWRAGFACFRGGCVCTVRPAGQARPRRDSLAPWGTMAHAAPRGTSTTCRKEARAPAVPRARPAPAARPTPRSPRRRVRPPGRARSGGAGQVPPVPPGHGCEPGAGISPRPARCAHSREIRPSRSAASMRDELSQDPRGLAAPPRPEAVPSRAMMACYALCQVPKLVSIMPAVPVRNLFQLSSSSWVRCSSVASRTMIALRFF
jgi:hypothetical protein